MSIILIGAGGNTKDIISFGVFIKKFKTIVKLQKSISTLIFDDNKKGEILGIPICGTVQDIIRKNTVISIYGFDDVNGNIFYNCIGSIGDNRIRNEIYNKLKQINIICQPLLLSDKINSNVHIGENVFINAGVQVHHDCYIGDNCVIAPNALLCGNVKLCYNNYIGAGAMIKQGVTIGNNSVIGMGSVVLHDIPENEVWVGNPARFLKVV